MRVIIFPMKNERIRPVNRFDLPEWSGAFGDLGTLIPFVVAYIAILGMNPNGLLVAFGISLIAAGFFYRTPFPVQPMKAIGASAVSQASLAAGLTASSVVGAALMTGVIWLLLASTGLAKRLSQHVPKSALLGVVMGLGFSFMGEGVRKMVVAPYEALALFVLTFLMLNRPRVPSMLILLALGVGIAVVQRPQLMTELQAVKAEFVIPSLAWRDMTPNDLWIGFIFLALPQLPLTFGNAFISITEENNRLFPNRPVNETTVALSTGVMNVFSSLIGGIPMCHGAGGMAGHIQFGARTGGSSIILGSVLLAVGVFLPSSVATLFKLFPSSVLGVILFFAGLQLALGGKDTSSEKADRFIVLGTAGIAVWNVGAGVLFGILAHHLAKSQWVRF
jgi:MFS superfamily sulfate permease-like transporter